MVRIVVTLALAAGGGCAMQSAPPAILIAEPPRPQAHPARDEVLAFQQYGRQIADRVALDPAFGGFIFRNEPAPHATVMFTGDAEARLRRYTTDPRFRAKRVQWTLAQLEGFKDQMGAQLSRIGLSCYSVDGDEEHNKVTIGAPIADLAKVRAAIARGAIGSPAGLRLVEQGCATWR